MRLLLRDDRPPDTAVAELSSRAARASAWTAAAGPLTLWLERLVTEETHADGDGAFAFDAAVRRWHRVAASVPTSLRGAAPPLGPGAAPTHAWTSGHDRLVAPRWTKLAAPVRRYLAARAFANWTALQGDGLVAWSDAIETALGVLHVEAARQCIEDTAPLDADRLRQAFRRADLLLLHLARVAPDVTA